jgi:hypothetical protein
LASRLQENDKVVLLTMLEEPNIVAGPSGPFPRAIVSLMRTRQVVLLIEHVRLSAFETTDGGWIRTRVDASITERFKSGPLPLSQRNVQFEFDGGQLAVNGVTVKTDRYPSFVEGTPHLVALARDADNDPWKLDHFWAHPGADGNMIAMKQSNGQFVSNTLHGQSMALVLDALRQRRPR